MKLKEIYGLSRSRDKQGNVVKRNLNPYVNCIHTQMGGGRLNMAVLVIETMEIAEPMIGAMRGRNPDNPSERAKSNGKYKQRLEMNENGTSNTITSVQKDNLVVEPMCSVHPLSHKFEFDPETSIKPLSPALRATDYKAPHCVYEPQVMTPKRTEFGKAVRKAYENKQIEMSRHDMTTMEPRNDGVSNTLTSVQKDNYLAIPEGTQQGYAEAHDGDSVNLAVPNSKTRRGRVGKQMANTLDTGCQQGVVEAGPQVKYRIRKLTPRECFRLMGVEDTDIDKLMSAGISNSQLYKCAGNSIVVDTLYHLFRKLFCDKESEEATYQQTLF